MTRQENILTLNEHLEHWKRLLSEKICDQSEGEKTIDALQNAIKALEEEPCEDCISRREAIKMFTYNSKGEHIPDYDCDNFPVQIAMKTVKEMLRDLPPVSPQPKVGKWIEHFDESGKWYECDQCHTDWGGSVNYCPNCGAKMQEVEE